MFMATGVSSISDGKGEATEVLSHAIAMELEGKAFFEKAAERMRRQRSKDMFLGLATQEERHIAILSHELGRLQDGRDWVGLDEAMKASEPSSGSPVFSQDRGGVVEVRPDAGELEVIDVGIEVEKRSIEYYREASRQSAESKAQQVFDWLVQEETSHLTILQAERDSRAGTGFHYDSMEFSLETE